MSKKNRKTKEEYKAIVKFRESLEIAFKKYYDNMCCAQRRK